VTGSLGHSHSNRFAMSAEVAPCRGEIPGVVGHMKSMQLHHLQLIVNEEEAKHVRAQQRAVAASGFMPPRANEVPDGHGSVATEHTLLAQGNQLQIQLEASKRRCQLLERRLHERQVCASVSRLSSGTGWLVKSSKRKGM